MTEKIRRVPEQRDDFFTIREIEFLQYLKRFKRVKDVGVQMGVSYRRAERILANIRRKWRMSVNTNNRLLSMSKRDEPFKKLLYSPAYIPPNIEIEENEDAKWESMEG